MCDNPQEKDLLDRSFSALVSGYNRASTIHNNDQERLYKFAGAYLGGSVAVATVILREVIAANKPIAIIPSLYLSFGGIGSAFFTVFYSYAHLHLIQSALFMNKLSDEAKSFIGLNSDFLRWDAFSAGCKEGRLRRIVNSFLSLWEYLPLFIAFFLSYRGLCKATTNMEYFIGYLAGTFSLISSLGALGGLFTIKKQIALLANDVPFKKRYYG